MKIVVTGGTGFIGCNLIAFLKKKGHFVRCVSKDINKLEKHRGVMFGQANELLSLDLRKNAAAKKAVEDMEYVIHLASDTLGAGYFGTQEYYACRNNIIMDNNILGECEKSKTFKRLFYTASFAIYPKYLQKYKNSPKLTEKMLYPADCDREYGWQKLQTLKLCEQAPFDARVGICASIFGPYQEVNTAEFGKTTSAFATRALKSLKTKIYEIWGNKKQTRSFLYIDDALEKIYQILTSDKYYGPVNIASDENFTFEAAAKLCCKIVGSQPKFTFHTKNSDKILYKRADNTKFEKLYSYKNKYTTQAGFEKLIHFLKN